MTVRTQFLFLAGDTVLDFVNTELVQAGARVDALSEPAALSDWLVEAGLLSRRAARERVSGDVLEAAKRLRAQIRSAAQALADGAAPSRAVVDAIDAELRRGRGALVLRHREERFDLQFEADPDVADDVLFLLARAAAAFLSSADPARVHRCGGTNCILFFYDATKSGTRRWCSMAVCGNRMKAAQHYRTKMAK